MRKYFLRHLNDNESIHRFVLLSGTIFVLFLASLVNISAYGLSLVVVGNLILSIFLERKHQHNIGAFRILSLVCYSFLLFYILQSPIFPAQFIALEIAYFLIKLLSVLIVVLLLIKKRNNLASVTILFLHYFDCILIRFINLDFVKTQTEYYSIFEFTSLSFWNTTCVALLVTSSSIIKASWPNGMTSSIADERRPECNLRIAPSSGFTA